MEQNGDDKATDRDRAANRREAATATDRLTSDSAAAEAKRGSATTRLGARYTVQEAAAVLGTTIDGVRGRIRRGTLDSMKVDGVVYVLLDEVSRDRHADRTTNRQGEAGRSGETSRQGATTPDKAELVEELRDQVGFLRRELERRDEEVRCREEEHREESRRKDSIIMQMAQRAPELEAPSEPREPPVRASQSTSGVAAPEQSVDLQEPGRAPARERSWLMRFFWGP